MFATYWPLVYTASKSTNERLILIGALEQTQGITMLILGHCAPDRLTGGKGPGRPAAGLPHGLFGPFRPFLVVGLAVQPALAEVGQDVPQSRQRLRIDVSFRVPKVRANDGAGALEVDG